MITLTFNRTGLMPTSHIPPEWRQNIIIMRNPNATNPNTANIFRVTISVDIEDSSYRYRALMQRPQLVLKFSLPYFVEFPVGTSCVFQNQTFTLNSPENLKRQGKRKIEYTMTLGTKEDNLSNYKLRNSVDGRLKWSMCARPHEFIEEIIKTLNKRDGAGVWFCNKAHIIEATEKTIEFNHVYCDAALSSVAETFETEYEIIDHNNGKFEIALHKVEYFKTQPLPLSYGRGNGFVPGVGRTTESDGKPIKRLYCQGGERNIDRSKYGSQFGYSNNPGELRLPKSQSLEYEGRTYTTDSQGYYIERSDKVSQAVKEDSLDCSEIYPSYIGKVTGVTNPNPEKNFFDIVDSNIPDNLNFNNYLIAGENMTIIFQSGMLAGREFEVKYRHEDKRWELVPMEEDGITFPNETFKPTVNADNPETYAVFGIMLPNEYICDNESKTGASWDMFKEGARYLREHEDQKFTFAGELQSIYAKRNWLQIGGYLKVGAYIHFTDNEFAVDGLDIRIIGVKDYVNNPYAPTLEISNSIQSPTTVSSDLESIDNSEVYTDEAKRQIIAFTKRRFRDAKETAEMLAQAALDNFSEGIAPITVQTMSALIGDESLQFEFFRRQYAVSSGGASAVHIDYPVSNPVSYSNTTHQLTVSTGFTIGDLYLRHLTLGINKISSESPNKSEYKTWKMTPYTSPVLSGEAMASKGFFLYAKCSKENFNDGTFVLSEKSIGMDSVNGYWHFLVGILTSMQDGERSYANLYGFTEILPGRITTDIIISADGKTWFDLKNGEIHGNIRFSNDMDIDDVINAYNATIIEGGKIKTDLIDVANLIARRLEVINANGAGVKIVPNTENVGSVSIYDENGNEVSVFEGAKYSSIASLYNDTTGTVAINTHRSGSDSVTVPSGSNNKSSNNAHVMSDVWYTDVPCETFLISGNLQCLASATGYQSSSSGGSSTRPGGISIINPDEIQINSSASAMVAISILTYSDAECTKQIHNSGSIASCYTSASAGMTITDPDSTGWIPGDTDTKAVNCAGKSVKIPAGYHKILIYYNISASRSGSYAWVKWGSSAQGGMDFTSEYKCNFYVSRFFANGFCLGLRQDNYAMVWNDGENMNFAVETGGYGFKVLPTGIKYRPTKNGDWKTLT